MTRKGQIVIQKETEIENASLLDQLIRSLLLEYEYYVSLTQQRDCKQASLLTILPPPVNGILRIIDTKFCRHQRTGCRNSQSAVKGFPNRANRTVVNVWLRNTFSYSVCIMSMHAMAYSDILRCLRQQWKQTVSDRNCSRQRVVTMRDI